MIIGISGKAGAGKDTTAAILCELLRDVNEGFNPPIILSFAYTLKRVSAFILNLPIENFNTESGKNTFLPSWGMTIREFLQRLGTDAVRNNLHPDAWVIPVLDEYTRRMNLNRYLNTRKKESNDPLVYESIVIVPDLRFQNEYNAIRNLDGITIRINRPGLVTMNHVSETQLDNSTWDFVVENDGSIDELRDKLVSIANEIRGRLKYAE